MSVSLPTADDPARILVGDALETLRRLPDGCVHCAATSPPYYGLRDYGIDGQLGLEATLDAYVARLVDIFREVRRVLHPTGVVWLNLGDSYASGAGGNANGRSKSSGLDGAKREVCPRSIGIPAGLKPKDLMGVPWAVAFALRADGWYLRSGCPWIKKNAMPESTTDRPASALEYVFLLSKGQRYYYDHAAVRVEAAPASESRYDYTFHNGTDKGEQRQTGKTNRMNVNVNGGMRDYSGTRNRRNTDWFFESFQGLYGDPDPLAFIVNPVPSDFAHFAMWPPLLVEPMIRAGSSEKGVCPTCWGPWVRQVEKLGYSKADTTRKRGNAKTNGTGGDHDQGRDINKTGGGHWPILTTGWQPSCKCDSGSPTPALVLDIFAGTGTTVAVAVKLKRRGLGIELNPEYAALAGRRLSEPLNVGGLFGPPSLEAAGLFDSPETP